MGLRHLLGAPDVRRPVTAAMIPLAVFLAGSPHARADPAPGSTADASLKSEGPSQPVKVEEGTYKDKDGTPTYHVTQGGKMVDWPTMAGYLRYNSNCIVCHGPDGAGSTYAPSLVDALKHDDYATFVGIVAGGKKDISSSQELVMPAFGENRNVMCYIDDIYVYLRARSEGVVGRGRPAEHEPKSDAYKKREDACMG
ncbi:c-type cytochrome, methanol metabolism-related [Methylobacterium gossipiicola]|uniref:C-type cytochrome, methanol metabolism-related n=2 Tax=Methylobacterium gossipiicola TaxID=582675 RepID=A0A1I2UE43_9HYPH|nr:c-type cytochrome, methanol metabolism-related [Methylobacterium gossipiicola]